MKHILFYFNIPMAGACLTLSWSRVFFACCFAFIILSCNKDLANISSSTSQEFSIELPKETGTLIKGLEGGDSILAQIKFPGQVGLEFDPTAYSFVWTSLRNEDTLSTNHYLTFKDFANQEPALISYLLTVREKKTGIVKHATSTVSLTTATREGWLLLGDKSGEAKFSMLTYTPTGYLKFIDFASELGISVPLLGKPISINALGTEKILGQGKYQLLGVATDQEIKFIQASDFEVNASISGFMTETLKPKSSTPVFFEKNGHNSFVANQNKNVFYFNTYVLSLGILFTMPVNYYPTPQNIFNASPLQGFTRPPGLSSEYGRIAFDEDNNVFVKLNLETGNNSILPLTFPFSLQDFQLKAISSELIDNQDEFTALLYKASTNESYLVQFLVNGIVRTVRKIPNVDANSIINSKNIIIDFNTGYIIYTKDNEIYAYDYKVGRTLPLLNFENEEITLLKMEKDFPTYTQMPGRVDVYNQLLKRLVVCTYNPSKPDNSGIFRLFRIPLGHQIPVKEVEEIGFPKIVDVTFVTLP